ncbi:MAG: GNAT family N-acetyltransferase [Actinomyces sp.]|uniref:GNAT family N-acetyltransferase n=1 Tax=Actinomyces sp. TaxID=29317 RepID=UPI0026DBBE1B|nr:GNAT family N-acetyltransferase [Actinomyces sp.]MDO4244253.1 GNAT family N-acetyltransferase [Actinomyces sp.]
MSHSTSHSDDTVPASADPVSPAAGSSPADPGRPGGFVREARPEDLEAMGRLHAAAILASLEAAHQTEHGGQVLPEGVRAMVSAPVITAGWEQAVLEPPSPEHHVLVATQDDEEGRRVVGLVGLAPAHGTPPDGAEGPGQRGVELTALAVDPAHQRQGHGSRLLAAAADHARVVGAEVLLAWAPRGDASLAGFLGGAGLTLTGSHRELPVGRGVVEECWAALM